MDRPHYIMHPNLYNELYYVRGFIDHNGKTYGEHVTIILKNILRDEQIKEFMKLDNPNDVLKKLGEYKINITHDYV